MRPDDIVEELLFDKHGDVNRGLFMGLPWPPISDVGYLEFRYNDVRTDTWVYLYSRLSNMLLVQDINRENVKVRFSLSDRGGGDCYSLRAMVAEVSCGPYKEDHTEIPIESDIRAPV